MRLHIVRQVRMISLGLQRAETVQLWMYLPAGSLHRERHVRPNNQRRRGPVQLGRDESLVLPR